MCTARKVEKLTPGHYYRIPSQNNVVAQYVGTGVIDGAQKFFEVYDQEEEDLSGVIISADTMCCRETSFTDKLNGLYYP